jgi:mono/diheme cytochrome c family protein
MARRRLAILTWCAGVLLVVSFTSVYTAPQSTAAVRAAAEAERHLATITQYCGACHSDRSRMGGVSFASITAANVAENAPLWEKALRKLRGRQMPPPGSRQPDQEEIDAFVAWMETALDSVGEAKAGLPGRSPEAKAGLPGRSPEAKAGYVPIQRLTRTEFGAAVNDLLGIELDAESLLPAEIEVHGFDNIAAALSISPAFLDQYVAASRVAAKLAVGEAKPKLASAYYPQPLTADQPGHVDGLPLGTRGGMTFRHTFPADGEYRFSIGDLGIDLYTRAVETRHTVIIVVDGREVFRESLGGAEDLKLIDQGGAPARAAIMKRFTNIPVTVKAGTYDVGVTFIERARIESDEFVGFLPGDEFSRGDRAPRVIGGVRVEGPFDSPGVSETASRRQIFVCRGQDQACARRIAESLARRAFRRPVTSDEIDSLLRYFDSGRVGGRVPPKPTGEGGFDAGIERMVAAILVSPEFLFRAIKTPPNTKSTAFPLSDLELASRLSFFLWSQGPDEALLNIAAAGKLDAPGVLEAEALRMLKDARASSLVRNFALKWMDLDNLREAEPDPNLFPTFNDQLRKDLAVEIEAFVRSVLLEDRNVSDLLTADHTFLNERLARHYGIASVLGPQFRRVTLDDSRRWGLLGKGAVLLKTSYGDRTSPVLRGAWIMDKLMGTPPTPPPPDVDTDLSQPKGAPPKTLRARLESHRSKPGCNQCHGVIDPIGLAMENYDAIGRWRDLDLEAKAPIDARTVLPNGRPVDGPSELRDALFGGRDLFVRAFTEKLMMYAVGRELEYFDMPQVRAVVRRAAAQEYRLSAIVSGIVASDAFRMQAVSAPSGRSATRQTVLASRSASADRPAAKAVKD